MKHTAVNTHRKNQTSRNPNIEAHQGYALMIIGIKSKLLGLEMDLSRTEEEYENAFNLGRDRAASRLRRKSQRIQNEIKNQYDTLFEIYAKIKKEAKPEDIGNLVDICRGLEP